MATKREAYAKSYIHSYFMQFLAGGASKTEEKSINANESHELPSPSSSSLQQANVKKKSIEQKFRRKTTTQE